MRSAVGEREPAARAERGHLTPSRRCPACGAALGDPAFCVSGVPVHASLLLASAAEARAFPTGDVSLAACPACGFVTNVAFDGRRLRYAHDYEDTQAHSPRFLAFARELATDLTERYLSGDSHVVEIGCGKGDFLTLLCDVAGCAGVGYDPAYAPGALTPGPEVRFVTERFTEAHGASGDLLVCRHTLEHVSDVATFVGLLRSAIAPDAALYLEVPDTGRVLAQGAFWDVYYEHCSYFTAGSIERLLRSSGFDVVELRTGFDDQYLMAEARPIGDAGPACPSVPERDDAAATGAALAAFGSAVAGRVAALGAELRTAAAAGQRTVLWGGGSKAVGLLAALGDAGAAVAGVIDVNPRKQGRYLPGSGQRVLAPGEAVALAPDRVLVLNPVYRDEVATALADLGLDPRLDSI